MVNNEWKRSLKVCLSLVVVVVKIVIPDHGLKTPLFERKRKVGASLAAVEELH